MLIRVLKIWQEPWGRGGGSDIQWEESKDLLLIYYYKVTDTAKKKSLNFEVDRTKERSSNFGGTRATGLDDTQYFGRSKMDILEKKLIDLTILSTK